jgi:hypothetical protein
MQKQKTKKTIGPLKSHDLILVTISTAKIFQLIGPHPIHSQMTLI